MEHLLKSAEELLSLLENKLVVNEVTRELWVYDKDGVTVIMKLPLTCSAGGNGR